MQWFAQAPANIALIKYMGKKDSINNTPINSSLSFTLNNLLSSVTLETQSGKKDFWEPLPAPGAKNLILSQPAQARFLQHLVRIKKHFNYAGAFVVRSSNNFPHSSGLASSASSFAALTKCAVLALSELTKSAPPSIDVQAQLSRMGSGSSCRSFFAPWVLWQHDSVAAIDLPYPELIHQVIVISHEVKSVSSSDAHQRVLTSKLYPNRSQRAEQNLKVLLNALQSSDWDSAHQICWREFQDMHQLFVTSSPSFSYMSTQSNEALTRVQQLWQREGDGPIVTMDAGPNIHLLYRPDQIDMAHKFQQDFLTGNYDVI